jgi:alkylation response protein AidB-like acyl-CoA dehydrogenase
MDLHVDPIQTRLAEAVDTALTRTGDLYGELAAIGLPQMSAPESLGGLGLGLSADIMVNSRLGYGLTPLSAHRETVLALELLADADPPEDLPEDLIGDLFKGVRHATTIGVHAQTGLRADADGRLWGDSEPLPAGTYSLAVVRAMAHHGQARWYVVPPREPTCATWTGEQLGQPAVRLHFTGAPARPLVLTERGRTRAMAAARVRQAAVLLGIAERALDLARTHVNRRVQFGRPLVELQTVAHTLARLVGEAEGWQLVLHETAWRWDREQDCSAGAAQVLAAASDHAMRATRKALQLHGVRGMLAHSGAATAYRLASVEATRMGTPASLWRMAAPGGTAAPVRTGLG